MKMKTLVITVAISLFLSSAVQAGHKGKHDNHHYYGHQKKHHGHHKHHHGHKHWRGSHHGGHIRHGGYAEVHVRPHFELSAQFGYARQGAVVVYQPYLYGSVRY